MCVKILNDIHFETGKRLCEILPACEINKEIEG